MEDRLKQEMTPDGWLVWADSVEENAKDDFDRFRAKTIRAAAKLARVMLLVEPPKNYIEATWTYRSENLLSILLDTETELATEFIIKPYELMKQNQK